MQQMPPNAPHFFYFRLFGGAPLNTWHLVASMPMDAPSLSGTLAILLKLLEQGGIIYAADATKCPTLFLLPTFRGCTFEHLASGGINANGCAIFVRDLGHPFKASGTRWHHLCSRCHQMPHTFFTSDFSGVHL